MLEWKSKDSNIKIISEIHHICDVQQFTLRAKDIIFSRLDINSFRTCYVWYLDHSGYVTKPCSALIYRDPHWKQQTASSLSLGSW